MEMGRIGKKEDFRIDSNVRNHLMLLFESLSMVWLNDRIGLINMLLGIPMLGDTQ